MKTVQALKAPWNIVENLSLGLVALGVAHELAGGTPRPWVWPLFFTGAITYLVLRILRWRAARDEAVRQRYMQAIEYSPFFEGLKALGTVVFFGLWYWLATTFLLE